jgi:hypothetical protein
LSYTGREIQVGGCSVFRKVNGKQGFGKSSVGISWVGGDDHDVSGLADEIRPLICIIFPIRIIKGNVWTQLSSLPIEKEYTGLILIVYTEYQFEDVLNGLESRLGLDTENLHSEHPCFPVQDISTSTSCDFNSSAKLFREFDLRFGYSVIIIEIYCQITLGPKIDRHTVGDLKNVINQPS